MASYYEPDAKLGEEAVGLRISIFCADGFDPSLEGVITSYDHETGMHGITFDTGESHEIDISRERVMMMLLLLLSCVWCVRFCVYECVEYMLYIYSYIFTHRDSHTHIHTHTHTHTHTRR